MSTAPQDLKYLDMALELAREAALNDEVPVGAVIVRENKIIGSGYNLRESRQDPLAHAEMVAIAAAARELGSWRLVDCELYVTLEPCPMCLAASQQARVSRIVYGAEDLKGGALSLGYRMHEHPKTNHRFQVAHAPHPECGQILRDFFRKNVRTSDR